MKKRISLNLSLLFIALITSCQAQQSKEENVELANQFDEAFTNYWYQGKAELSSYELTQARYGEFRKGSAVLVFVTEDFLVDKQVKLEKETDEPSTSVLKLNFIRKFNTGIYDYSMMTSTFSPVIQDKEVYPLKSSSSSQEWCGHSWLQLNQKGQHYQVQSFSYFQSEGDVEKEIQKVLLEDGIWAQLRLNPDLIPQGKQKVFPSAHYLRFAHKELKPYTATFNTQQNTDTTFTGEDLMALEIHYPNLDRKVTIVYEKDFPHEIAGWKESRISGFGANAKKMETVAIKNKQLITPYWSQNKNKDSYLRDSLKLK
ncbi:MAG: septum formation inhibitor Maf [Vicingaceae bacterium]